jgi:hypothetical protein
MSNTPLKRKEELRGEALTFMLEITMPRKNLI